MNKTCNKNEALTGRRDVIPLVALVRNTNKYFRIDK